MKSTLHAIVTDAFGKKADQLQAIGGGSVNQTGCITMGEARFFVKWNAKAPAGFFEREAQGLELLRQAGNLRVPEVIRHNEASPEHPAYLVLEWLEPSMRRTDAFAEKFGHSLAELHRHTAPKFGLTFNNFIADLPQTNTPYDNWVDFFRDCRIMPQIHLAQINNQMPNKRLNTLARVIEVMDMLLLVDEMPSLLHGDLWSGNFLALANDTPALIDPAVYYGHREVDLAMTELFGGFSKRFYAAYEESFPTEDGYQERKYVYQLYPLLVHLNLFGEEYGEQVDVLCERVLG